MSSGEVYVSDTPIGRRISTDEVDAPHPLRLNVQSIRAELVEVQIEQPGEDTQMTIVLTRDQWQLVASA